MSGMSLLGALKYWKLLKLVYGPLVRLTKRFLSKAYRLRKAMHRLRLISACLRLRLVVLKYRPSRFVLMLTVVKMKFSVANVRVLVM